MTTPAGIFDSGDDFDVSGFAPQKPKPAAAPEKVREVAEAARFRSREPEPKPVRREPRRYRTGRNAQFNIKADPAVIQSIYAISDEQGWVLGETLERALHALQKEISGRAGEG